MAAPSSPADLVSVGRMPRWYRALFTADLLERFAFYGLQAVLVLYASAPRAEGGLGLGMADAAALFGAWIAVVFMLSLPGGWVGDRLLGQRRALYAGSGISAAGYLCLAVPAGWAATVGLCLLAMGGGLYKPNHQALGTMMFTTVRGRESGVSLMYVATQVSALLAPIVIGYLGERVSWSLAFTLAAVVMALAGLRVAGAARRFGDTGAGPGRRLTPAESTRVLRRTVAAAGALAVLIIVVWAAGRLTAASAIGIAGLLSVITPVIGYWTLRRDPDLGEAGRRRLLAFLPVFLGATLFWMIIAHAASLLNLFARDHVDRDVFGFLVPTSWFQAVNPAFVLLLSPIITEVLPAIGRRHNLAVKFFLGLGLVGTAFLVMSVAAALAEGGDRVSPLWLVVVYLGTACGEVVIAAVSIAAAASLLPAQFTGRMLGMYWLFASLGGALGSGLVRLAEVLPHSLYYAGLGTAALAAALAFLLARVRLTRSLTGDPTESPIAEGPETWIKA